MLITPIAHLLHNPISVPHLSWAPQIKTWCTEKQVDEMQEKIAPFAANRSLLHLALRVLIRGGKVAISPLQRVNVTPGGKEPFGSKTSPRSQSQGEPSGLHGLL